MDCNGHPSDIAAFKATAAMSGWMGVREPPQGFDGRPAAAGLGGAPLGFL